MAIYSYRPPWEYSVILRACSGAPVPREQLRRSTCSRKAATHCLIYHRRHLGLSLGICIPRAPCSGSRLDVAYFAEGCTWDDVVSHRPGGASLVVHVASQVVLVRGRDHRWTRGWFEGSSWSWSWLGSTCAQPISRTATPPGVHNRTRRHQARGSHTRSRSRRSPRRWLCLVHGDK